MSELVWLTLIAMAVFLVLLIPGNYLISLFWERDPSNLAPHARDEEVRTAEGGRVLSAEVQMFAAVGRMVAVVEMRPDALKELFGEQHMETVFSSTQGALPTKTVGQTQQTPVTTVRGFDVLAAT
jgi:hypothetical protein